MIEVTTNELLPSRNHYFVNVLRPTGLHESALFYKSKIMVEDGTEFPVSSNINMKYGKTWDKYTDSPNYVYRVTTCAKLTKLA